MSTQDLSDLSPSSKSKPRSIATALIFHALAWGWLFALLAVGVPKSERVFKDFGIDLPGICKIVIKSSHVLIMSLYVLLPLAMVLFVLNGVVLAALARNQHVMISRVWSFLILVLPLLATGFIVIGLMNPWLSLMTLHNLSD